MTSRRFTFRTVGLATVALMLAACGGGGESDTSDLPTLSGDSTAVASEAPADTIAASATPSDSDADVAAEPSSDAAAASETEPGAVDDEAALLAVAQCMRDEGIDFPDPMTNADGSVSLDFQGMIANGVDPQSDQFTAALETCGQLADGVTFGGAGRGDNTEMRDTLLALAECMRDNGISDFPDPTANQSTPGSPFGDYDFEDPAVAPVFETCRVEVNLPEFGGGQG